MKKFSQNYFTSVQRPDKKSEHAFMSAIESLDQNLLTDHRLKKDFFNWLRYFATLDAHAPKIYKASQHRPSPEGTREDAAMYAASEVMIDCLIKIEERKYLAPINDIPRVLKSALDHHVAEYLRDIDGGDVRVPRVAQKKKRVCLLVSQDEKKTSDDHGEMSFSPMDVKLFNRWTHDSVSSDLGAASVFFQRLSILLVSAREVTGEREKNPRFISWESSILAGSGVESIPKSILVQFFQIRLLVSPLAKKYRDSIIEERNLSKIASGTRIMSGQREGILDSLAKAINVTPALYSHALSLIKPLAEAMSRGFMKRVQNSPVPLVELDRICETILGAKDLISLAHDLGVSVLFSVENEHRFNDSRRILMMDIKALAKEFIDASNSSPAEKTIGDIFYEDCSWTNYKEKKKRVYKKGLRKKHEDRFGDHFSTSSSVSVFSSENKKSEKTHVQKEPSTPPFTACKEKARRKETISSVAPAAPKNDSALTTNTKQKKASASVDQRRSLKNREVKCETPLSDIEISFKKYRPASVFAWKKMDQKLSKEVPEKDLIKYFVQNFNKSA